MTFSTLHLILDSELRDKSGCKRLGHPLNRETLNQKNPRAHKNKIGTSPPPPNPKRKIPPPKMRNFMDIVFSCRKNAIFPGAHKIGAAISGPELRIQNFTDTRIFLTKN